MMAVMNVIPDVLVQKIYKGGAISGVAPTSTAYSFSYENLAVASFTVGESVSWGSGGTAGDGTLVAITVDGTDGTMIVVPDTGVAPGDGLTVTGASSTATCDVVAGTVVTGSVLADTEESLFRGRYRHYSGLTDGGLVEFPDNVGRIGFRINHIAINLPGITAVSFNIIDIYGTALGAGTATLSSGIGYHEWTHRGVFIPPWCKFKVFGTGTLTGTGEIMLAFSHGWMESTFDEYATQLGKINLPPSR